MRAPATRFPPGGWSIAFVAALALSTSYLDRQALSFLAPTVREALGIDHRGYGLLVGAFALAYLAGAPLAGRIVDRKGARIALALALLLMSIVSGLHALAPSLAVLLVLRLLLGASAAPSLPAAVCAVRRVLPPRDRTGGYGTLFTGSSLGAIAAAPIVIGIKVLFGWKAAFYGIAAIGIIAVPIWFMVTGGARAEQLRPHGEPRQRAEEISLGEVLRERYVQRALVVVLFSAPAVMFVYYWYAQLLTERFYESQDDLWKYLWLPPLFFDVGVVAFGWLAGRGRRKDGRGRGHLMFVGGLLVGALALVPFVNSSLVAVALAAVCMIGAGGLHVLATTDMLARSPVQMVSRAGGVLITAQSIAYLISGPLVGAWLDHALSYTPVLIGTGALALPASLAWALWPTQSSSSDSAGKAPPPLTPATGKGVV
jgi:MFS transporter, ACS family, hexuronate transporter